jgi:cell division protein FtsZ
MKKSSRKLNAVEILHQRYIGDSAERKASLETERINAKVARMIYDIRKGSGLTQKELAQRIDTTQSVISRLEDADYEGHSLGMLYRIAEALGKDLRVEMSNGEDLGSTGRIVSPSPKEMLENRPNIKVVAIGGAGADAVNSIIGTGLDGLGFITIDTDPLVLEKNLAPIKIRVGIETTHASGTEGNPGFGAKAVQEDIDKIRAAVAGSDLVFIILGLGGGTGTGGAPIVAHICKEIGALTVAVVTKPLMVEPRILQHAEDGFRDLLCVVDTLIPIPLNQSLSLETIDLVNDSFVSTVKGISDLIVKRGYLNVDFNDVRTVMAGMGLALMGTGVGRGKNGASHAVRLAISNAHLENVSLRNARAALINISAGPNLGMNEFEKALSIIQQEVNEEADIILGMVVDESMGDKIRVTVIATGVRTQLAKPVRTTVQPTYGDHKISGATVSLVLKAKAGSLQPKRAIALH